MASLLASGSLLSGCSGPTAGATCSLISRQQILALAVRADVRVDRIAARLMSDQQFEGWVNPGGSGSFPSTMVWAVATSGQVTVMSSMPQPTPPRWVVRAYDAGTGELMAVSSGGMQPTDTWPRGFDALPDASAGCPVGPSPPAPTGSLAQGAIAVGARVPLPGHPAQVGVDPGTHRIFVTSQNPDDRLTVLDGAVEPPKPIATVT
ncbi:MAG TPA: hypothetical protein VET65_03325, partial [Candidatus Limnocylindrales bacterium]|nr:hypothetical protein [Candidatus Limnocylindrales bacterium]